MEVPDVVTTNLVVVEIKWFVNLRFLFSSLFLDLLDPLELVVLSSHSRQLHHALHLGVHLVIFDSVVLRFRLVFFLGWLWFRLLV